MHISLGGELDSKLKSFKADRAKCLSGISGSEIIRNALTHLFSTEYPQIEKEIAVRVAIGRHFSVPKVFSSQAFFLFLYKLAQECPKKSSKQFWGTMIYLSGINKTNRQVYEEIADEINRELVKAK